MSASVVDQLLNWLTPLFATWGYPIIFGGVFLESIFLTGWIAPGTTVILLGGFYAAQAKLNVFMVWVTALVAALLGDNVGYLIGRKLGRETMEHYGGRPKLRKRMQRSQDFFSRYGGATVIFGRLVSGIDSFIPLTAGLNAMPLWRYMSYDVPGAALWSGLFTALGYFFGNNWRTIDRIINYLGWGALGLIAVVIIAILLVKRHRKEKEPGAEDDG